MASFDSFLHPERKPHAKFKMQGFGDAEFEMKVVSREEEKLISEQYKDLSQSDAIDLLLAFSLVNPPLLNKAFLDDLEKREGRRIMDPLEVIHVVFTANECNFLYSKYRELADLTVNANEKVNDLKNGSGEAAQI